MGQHDRSHQVPPKLPASDRPGRPARSWPVRPVLIAAALVGGLGLSLWLSSGPHSGTPTSRPTEAAASNQADSLQAESRKGSSQRDYSPAGSPSVFRPDSGLPVDTTSATRGKPSAGSFLEGFAEKGTEASRSVAGPVPPDEELEKTLRRLAETGRRIQELQARLADVPPRSRTKEREEGAKERDRLTEQLNRDLASFEKVVAAARESRPGDPVPEWLTGELLQLVGGEPDRVLPYLRKAAAAGLDRPGLLVSLSRALFESNQFEQAYHTAVKALERDGRDRAAWEAFARAAFSLERYEQVLGRLDRSFPSRPPDWAESLHREAAQLRARWLAEQQLRRAEEKADDLPRVRLTVEHRRFVRTGEGTPTKIESTGRGEVVVELFEDQAPATVANFIDLASRGFYDGTRFYLAEPASLVAGGDPKSKRPDPADDGAGGPGYVIPDEFLAPGARGHFRGSLSMVDTGPHTAGSQFFITLAPKPEMDGQFTVFGRVIQGQEVVDAITRGRTTRQVGRFGPIIPGDLLLNAEVIRKRPHEYHVFKERPTR